jgi:hypothetical protein
MIRVDLSDGDAAAEHRDNVLEVWNEAFGAVGDVAGWRETVWDRHRARADFRLATAYDDSGLVGSAGATPASPASTGQTSSSTRSVRR